MKRLHFWLADFYASNFIPPSIMIKDAWNQVLKDFAGESSQNSSLKWLYSAKPGTSTDSSRLILNVPDNGILSHLREYTRPIEVKMASILGRPVRVEFQLSHSLPEWIHPEYSFETFLESKCNSNALQCIRAACRQPGRHNPIFLSGPANSGKTHLLHSYARSVIEAKPGARIAYLSGIAFKLGHLRAIASRSSLDFKESMMSFDCVIFDDIHLIGSGKSTLEEIDFLITAFLDRGKQIVCSSSTEPGSVFPSGRLRSRILSGIVVQMESVDADLRRAFCQKMAEVNPNILDHSTIQRICKSATDIREIKSIFGKIELQSRESKHLSTSNIDSVIEGTLRRPAIPSIHAILEAVTRHYHVSKQDILSSSRKTEHTWPRHVAMYLALTQGGMSKSAIARFFKKKDHTTVVHAEKKIQIALENDDALAGALKAIVSTL